VEYSQLVVKGDEIKKFLGQQQDQLATLKSSFTVLKTNLENMQGVYAPVIQAVNALHVASPDDLEIQVLKAQIDRNVAEFEAAKAEAVALETAVAGV